MADEPEPDYYALIGVAPDATPEEIRRAYGDRIRETMNDRPRFEALTGAFDVLRDTAKRAAYDRRRMLGTPVPETIQKTKTTMNTESTMAMPPNSAPPLAAAETAAQSTSPGSKTLMYGGERTQAVVMTPCPVCGTTAVPGEAFCVECGFLLGSVAGDEAATRPLPRLVDASGREFALHPGENTVGREGADVMLPDKTVSRRHARIMVEESGIVWTEDLGSTNGTRVSGAPLPGGKQMSLRDRAPIQFGSIKLTVLIPEVEQPDMLALPSPLPDTGADANEPIAALAAPQGAGSGVAARLIGKGNTEHILKASRTTFGRRPGNDIVITDDPFVSGSHAEVVYDDGTFLLTDLGSTNGTKLNGRRLLPDVPQPLADGDEMVLGQTGYTFRAATAAHDAV